jgi:FlaA1/EpsC-like NDP-sugar epimerase
VVVAIVALASVTYHLQAYGHVGSYRITLELATMIASIFVFTNALRGRYQLSNYLSTKGQIASAFTVWNVTMVAFIAIVFLAKIVDHYSRAVVLVTYLTGIPLITLARSTVVRTISMASKTGRITSERVFLIGREPDVMSFVSRHQPWNIGFSIVDVAFLRSNDAAPHQRSGGRACGRSRHRRRPLPPDAAGRGLHRAALVLTRRRSMPASTPS